MKTEQLLAMPLNGRNFVSLTRSVPGVLRGIPGANIDGAGSLAWRASASFSANGQRARDNNFMLDGVDNNETWLQTVVIFPSVDSLDEFKLQTSTYSAEFGRSLGGVVNLQIKSGTNMLRGSGFEFHRNDAFDANNFFNNRAGRAKPDFKQNQFGGTLGGAVFRDKTFFFGAYQGHREEQGQTFLSTVPSVAMRSGNFSELTRAIYDPHDRAAVPRQHHPGRSHRHRRPQHPHAALSGAEPSRARRNATTGQTIDNHLINPIKERQDNQFDVKVDHNLSVNNRFFTRYSFQKTHRLQPATLAHGDAGATFGAGEGNIKAQSLAFNDTHTLSSRWLNEFRFGWSSIKFLMTPIDYGTNPAEAVGLPGINLNQATSAMTQLDVPEHPQSGRQQQPAAHHEPERLPVLRQRDVEHGQAHVEDGRQPDAALARNPQRRHDRRQFQLQQQHDVELRRPAGRLHGQQQHRLRRRELHAGPREHEEPQSVRREDLHGEAAGNRMYVQDDFRVEPQADDEHRVSATTSIRRGSRSTICSRISMRRPASSSSPPTTRCSMASRSAATCRPIRRRTSARASDSPMT